MDAIGAISAMQQAELAMQVQYAVAEKALSATQQQGEAAIALLNQAAELSDDLAAASGQLLSSTAGKLVDLYA